ncbi:MAG: polyhydroxybutyrate depolymerase [Urechidicola sp.]|jgi:polyhydroxybutyrate depolymerase
MKSIFLIASLLLAFTINSQSTIDKTIMSGGIPRSYKLYIPAMYDGTSSVALVLNLHGRGSNNLQQMFYGDFRTIADTANFIIVHPQGTYESSLSANYWNAYFGGAVNDINFLAEMIDTISTHYNIDINRVHSTGMSNGGYMSLALAAGLNDKIASVASVTGSMTHTFPSSTVNTKSISVMQIHGTADSTVQYGGNRSSKSIQDVLNYWVSFNNTTSTPTIDSIPNTNTTDSSTAIRYTYGSGTDNTEVIHYKIIGGEHTWPNSAFITGVTNKDFDASKVIWAFFNKHQKVNTVGVKEIEKLNFVSLVNDIDNNRLILKNVLPNSKLDYVIYDMSGKIIERNQLVNEMNEVETQSFNSGMYVIRVIEVNSSRINSFKFVVK